MKRKHKGPPKGSPSPNPAGRNAGGPLRTERLQARVDPATMDALRRYPGSIADAVIEAVRLTGWPESPNLPLKPLS